MKISHLVVACFAVVLAACGGGGSSGDTTPPPTPTNTAPAANAGPLQSVLVGTAVTLDGSGSDANGDALTFSWTLTSMPTGSAAALASSTSAKPTFSADMAGTYVASLIVNDGKVNSTTSTVSITAAVANAAPVAAAGIAQNVLTATTITLDGSGSSDANGDLITYAWTLTSKPAGSTAALASVTSPKPTFNADLAGTYSASLIVNDGKLNSAASTVSISAAEANVAPVAVAGIAQNVLTATTITLDGSGSSDANGDPITYAWTLTSRPAASTAALASATSPKPTFSADVAGAYVASLIVNDGKVNSTTATVSVTATVANAAPVANAGTAQNIIAGSRVTLNGSASSDANGDALTYAWTLTGKPTGSAAALTVATSAMPTFVADVAGTYVASLIVNDGKVNSTTATVSVTATVANAAPVANAGVAQNVTTGALVVLDGSASSDANGDPLSYSWQLISIPLGSGVPLTVSSLVNPSFFADIAGTYVARLIVNDGKVNSAAATVTITAAVANVAPAATINYVGTPQVVVGTVVSVDGRASSDANGDPLTFKWAFRSRPTGSSAAFASTTSNVATFIPDIAGDYVITLVVNDGKVESGVSWTTYFAAKRIASALSISDSLSIDFCTSSGSAVSITSTQGNGIWSWGNCKVFGRGGSVLFAAIQNNGPTALILRQITIRTPFTSQVFPINSNSQNIWPKGTSLRFALSLWADMDVTNATAEFIIDGELPIVVDIGGSLSFH